jgi:hypothetical protein
MLIGDVLAAKGLVSPEDFERAVQHQAANGGRLTDVLVAQGLVEAAALEDVLALIPPPPSTLVDIGISEADLMNLLVKTLYSGKVDTGSKIAEALCVPGRVAEELLNAAVARKLAETLGASEASTEIRYALTDLGRRRAFEALEVSQYVGPAPVSLAAYHARIHYQRITNETVGRRRVADAFADLVMTPEFVDRLGPGINSGRCILLYGPPGNGKTTIAEKVGKIFEDVVFIPHCIEVEGQIIKIFDPSIHESILSERPRQTASLRREEIDRRWVPCRRPIIVTGGELTLEMLDLKFSVHSRFYEAPLHMKALNGTFIIDDFGRQLVSPEDLLNRWIVPLQSRIDYLKLHTGKSFSIPFDELIIFSTNMDPQDLMDPAFLRRIPYKIATEAPARDEFKTIFTAVAAQDGLDLSEEMFAFVLEELTVRNNFQLACYQPRFIVDQVISACKYEGIPPEFSRQRVAVALDNLYTRSNPGRRELPKAA